MKRNVVACLTSAVVCGCATQQRATPLQAGRHNHPIRERSQVRCLYCAPCCGLRADERRVSFDPPEGSGLHHSDTFRRHGTIGRHNRRRQDPCRDKPGGATEGALASHQDNYLTFSLTAPYITIPRPTSTTRRLQGYETLKSRRSNPHRIGSQTKVSV